MNDKYQHYFAKIKDIYLELPGFSYFHSPSGRFRDNPKMVGRGRVKKRLYGLLTNSETKTGSYIITGFRGVGKTSLVNQVINELQPRTVIFKQAAAVLATWGLLHFLFLLLSIPLIYGLAVPLVLVLANFGNEVLMDCFKVFNGLHRKQQQNKFLIDNSEYRRRGARRLFKKWTRILKQGLPFVYSFPILDLNFYVRSNANKIVYLFSYAGIIEFIIYIVQKSSVQTVLISSGVFVISFLLVALFFNLLNHKTFTKYRRIWLGLVFPSILVAILVNYYLVFVPLKKPDQLVPISINVGSILALYSTLLAWSFIAKWGRDIIDQNKGKVIKKEVFNFLNLIKKKLNHSQKIFVRLSFPQEAITSKDILKSFVQNMNKEFNRYAGFNHIGSKVVIGLMFWLVGSFMYHQPMVEDGVKSLKKSTNIAHYFPSQRIDPEIISHHTKVNSRFFNQTDSVDGKVKSDSEYLEFFLNEFGVHDSVEGEEASELTGLRRITVVVDYYFYWIYGYAWNFIDPINLIPAGNYPHIIPPFPDIGYFLWLLLILGFRKLLLWLSPFVGIMTKQHVKRLLKELNTKCLAETELRRTQSYDAPVASMGLKMSFGKSKSLKYPIASARDIENDLIHIFDSLDRIPKLFAPPEFNFVFDELDKVDPMLYFDTGDMKEEIGNMASESEKLRKKRELVSGIMASMKIFFTTAKAKFIFIAGREMYDASLADSSDRESYLGSIFHDVIYVSSLYKDPFDDHTHRIRKPVDITYLVERYVCGRLIPPRANYPHNMVGYSRYLDDLLDDKEKDIIRNIQKRKIINSISVFVNYLAYRSKGSPMNMVKLFETFAEEFPYREDDIFDDSEKLIVGSGNPKSYYLTFDFHAQYRISLVAGIFRPFVLSTGTHLKKYSDKILVSTSYLLDHIYKFHEFGFSWRNLELLPEIIDINRAPQLRRHVERIVGFLGDTSLKRIDNGLVTFKFQRKVIEDINLLSRSSDSESAIFNFTLDESNAIKIHYRRSLKKLHESHSATTKENFTFINSIAFIESVLGDLHFFDKEYDEALIHYSNAVQGLQEKFNRGLSLHETLVFTRTLMREALVYERMNTYAPALSKYSQLTEIIRKNGRRLNEIGNNDLNERNGSTESTSETKPPINPKGSKDDQSNNEEEDGLGTGRVLREGFHFAKSMYENFSIMFLPILAKLVAIEKHSKQGITLKDALRADRDFHSVLDYIKKDEKYLLKVEYHLQKGNIFYYKNGIVYRDYEVASTMAQAFAGPELPHCDFNAPYSAYKEYITGISLLLKKLNESFDTVYALDKPIVLDDKGLGNPRVGEGLNSEHVIENYNKFTRAIEQNINGKESILKFEKAIIRGFIDCLRFDQERVTQLNITHNMWNLAARLLSAMGDSLMILCNDPSINYFGNSVGKIFNPVDKDILEQIEARNLDGISRLELALLYFGVASICYSRANEDRNRAFQHKKIIYVIKTYAKFFDASYAALWSKMLLNKLGEKVIQAANANRQFIIFPEASKSRETDTTIVSSRSLIDELPDYYRFSYNTGVKMPVLHWYSLHLIDFKRTNFSCIADFEGNLDKFPINSYNTVNDQMVRMFELKLKSMFNRKLLVNTDIEARKNNDVYQGILADSDDPDNEKHQKLCDQELLDMLEKPDFQVLELDDDQLKFLIIDGIYCELRIIEGIKLNDLSYIRGYHYLGCAYLSLAWWIEVWALFCEERLDEKGRRIARMDLIESIGSHELHYAEDAEYAYQRALNYYYECINLHSEGGVYKSLLSNMYFTEGDFNDDNQHFCAAMDRLLINNRLVRRRIQYIKNKLADISIFNSKSDYENEPIPF